VSRILCLDLNNFPLPSVTECACVCMCVCVCVCACRCVWLCDSKRMVQIFGGNKQLDKDIRVQIRENPLKAGLFLKFAFPELKLEERMKEGRMREGQIKKGRMREC